MKWLNRLLRARTNDVWVPTHRHKKGGLYRMRFYATLEADLSAVAVYDDSDGTIWVRSAQEFDDGRFVPIDDAGAL